MKKFAPCKVQQASSHQAGVMHVARFAVFLALIVIASCNGSPPYGSSPYCQGKPCLNASLEKGKVDYRVLLVGDAGASVDKAKDKPGQSPPLKALQYFAEFIPDRTAIVFLGDNIYNAGLPDETQKTSRIDKNCLYRACAEERIDAQIDVLKASGAKGIFIPGNHDWDDAGREGWKRVNNQEEYIAGTRDKKKVNVDLIPKKGCPGPVTVSLAGEKIEISLIALDTQWWLHDYDKPGKDEKSVQCEQLTELQVIKSLQKKIKEEKSQQRHIMLVGHHPLMSYGEHGGFYSMDDLVRPLYLIEQIIRNSIFSGRQDLPNAIYKNMSMRIQDAIQTAYGNEETPLIYAAGHDHSLQIIKDKVGRLFHLVSGGGSGWNATRVGQGEGTLFSHANRKGGGFIAVDYLQSGEIRFAVIEPRFNGEECKRNGGKACVVFSAWATRPLS